MKALILLSHGSRRPESNAEMQALGSQIHVLPDNPFAHVACAFQQFAEPGFKQTVEDLIDRGVTNIVVLPLFLASGSHVLFDVPEMIEAARAQHPRVSMTVMPHLGQTQGLARFLLDQANGY